MTRLFLRRLNFPPRLRRDEGKNNVQPIGDTFLASLPAHWWHIPYQSACSLVKHSLPVCLLIGETFLASCNAIRLIKLSKLFTSKADHKERTTFLRAMPSWTLLLPSDVTSYHCNVYSVWLEGAHCNYIGPMTPGTGGLPANLGFL